MSKKNQAILLTGGAGYIGSHMVDLLCREGYRVVVLDNLSTGNQVAVSAEAEFVKGDLSDVPLLESLFASRNIGAVMHFAASIQVGESVLFPESYYANNFTNTLGLLDTMVKHGVLSFIFSSTAAVYGEPEYLPVNEIHPKKPVNPYGRSKWIVEEVLADYEVAHGLKSVSLRYFNAAGAHPERGLGPRYAKITHLILLVLQVARGVSDHIDVFGDDYDTSDGTCVRDYVHVLDLCSAHLLALAALQSNKDSKRAYNLGSGKGYSVKQVIETARAVTGHPIPVEIKGRRAGDPAILVANTGCAEHSLGWKTKYTDLNKMISDTWDFIHEVCKA